MSGYIEFTPQQNNGTKSKSQGHKRLETALSNPHKCIKMHQNQIVFAQMDPFTWSLVLLAAMLFFYVSTR